MRIQRSLGERKIGKKISMKNFLANEFQTSYLNPTVNKTVSESEARLVPPPPPFAPPLLYPVNAATGILVAIAVPVPLEDQNVFVSYNFEGNYNMPNVAPDSFPGKIDRWTVNFF